MFGLSFGEIVIIAVIALLLLGPDRLPDAAKTLGKGLREIRKATDELKDQVEAEIYADPKKHARPALVVPPVAVQPVPGPAGPPPVATAENVPGLDVALLEPVPAGAEAPPADAAPLVQAQPATAPPPAAGPPAEPSRTP
jgi:sec-independent protein translocase protein TatB